MFIYSRNICSCIKINIYILNFLSTRLVITTYIYTHLYQIYTSYIRVKNEWKMSWTSIRLRQTYNIKNSLSTLWSTLIFPGDEYNGMTHSVKIRVSREMWVYEKLKTLLKKLKLRVFLLDLPVAAGISYSTYTHSDTVIQYTVYYTVYSYPSILYSV